MCCARGATTGIGVESTGPLTALLSVSVATGHQAAAAGTGTDRLLSPMLQRGRSSRGRGDHEADAPTDDVQDPGRSDFSSFEEGGSLFW